MIKNKSTYESIGLITSLVITVICVIGLVSTASAPTSSVPESQPNSSPAKSGSAPNQSSKSPTVPPQAIPPGKPASAANSAPTPAKLTPAGSSAPQATKTGDFITTSDGQRYPNRPYRTLALPNDPSANQWWVAPTGMSGAWNVPAGSTPVRIAIIDTGFGLDHQEFSGRWDVNSSDPVNGLDDDNNGYADDWRGWDFDSGDNSPMAGEINPSGGGVYHGSMVAGIMAANGNNGVGIAGVNWYARLLPIQALSDNGSGDSYSVGQAIYYAADRGVDVINLSLGTNYDDPYIREASLYALKKGAVVVAAAGNDGCNCMVYPARYPEILSVGASGSNNQPASFSSYGADLDIIAPGSQMTSAYWSNSNRTTGYGTGAGTSYAAPFVSGLIGLALSHQPSADSNEIIAALIQNGDRRSLSLSSPRTDQIGFGYVHAGNLLSRLTTASSPSLRYIFSGSTIVGSPRTRQCEAGELPSSQYYRLTKAGETRYTADKLARLQLIQQGWAAQNLFFACMGLPTDRPATVRLINLEQEIFNLTTKQ